MPMKIMEWDLGIPVIYDQHDFLSGKREKELSPLLLAHERYCNEENDGAIFITNYYKQLVAAKYSINELLSLNNNEAKIGFLILSALIPLSSMD